MAIQTFSSGQTLTAAQMNSLQANDYNQTVSAKTTSYTLVAGDVGTHVQMTASTATTISVPAATFAAGDSLFISSQGAGAVTIQAASTAITVTGSSTSLALYGGGTLRFQSSSAATFFKQGGGTGYGVATGGIGSAQSTGTLADGFSYSYLTFNSTGTLTVTTAGWFDYLAIGGGGGSMSLQNASYASGGGGAGQVISGSIYLSANQTITIGAGSSFFNYTSYFQQASETTIGAASPFNVGAVGNAVANTNTAQPQGHIGGGTGAIGSGITAGNESLLIGYRGGTSGATTNGGGGGGQSARGGNGSGTTGGTGGAGYDISAFIGGSAALRAQGGGGGGSVTGGAAATGGVAGSANTTPPNGGANTGQGGGGGHGVLTTGNGGSGVCFIRFR